MDANEPTVTDVAAVGPEWTDVMVDIETTHTLPDRGAILQIAAVKFNLKQRTINPEYFCASLTMPPHRAWDQSTQTWWLNQKRSVLTNILAQARPYRDVINEFAEWSYQNPGFRFWSKPTHFDFSFLASYFYDENLPNPFHFRVARDLNSYLEALFYPNEIPAEVTELKTEGDAHNALNDVWHQLNLLFKATELKCS